MTLRLKSERTYGHLACVYNRYYIYNRQCSQTDKDPEFYSSLVKKKLSSQLGFSDLNSSESYNFQKFNEDDIIDVELEEDQPIELDSDCYSEIKDFKSICLDNVPSEQPQEKNLQTKEGFKSIQNIEFQAAPKTAPQIFIHGNQDLTSPNGDNSQSDERKSFDNENSQRVNLILLYSGSNAFANENADSKGSLLNEPCNSLAEDRRNSCASNNIENFKKLEEEKVQEKTDKCQMINIVHPQFTQKSNEISEDNNLKSLIKQKKVSRDFSGVSSKVPGGSNGKSIRWSKIEDIELFK